ncbi:D-glycero-beta-D-manno-heptose-7-phosphate kinase [Telmatospirillum sp.]|uniref:D-glycero-beta-D-manno-heptose-7-phosphate kinase n=1 Tax=Telmatospirillum sp. TaxID=2079197 RepID=UPI00284E614A|nr:D-glycero-beta-D-manno-heptose-7-phosphate kinase [Telmatospirillum sp.]MDR3436992.1 D-glycero-beta-D-manno-heptose-7-phosphate kinase [Telmatospirillum sp.]
MTDHSVLATRVSAFKQAQILCIGDVMLDQFVYGDVDRISPEAPIPVLRVRRETAMLGGAGNVVRNLGALGAVTHFVSLVGDDMAGREVTRLVGLHSEVDPALVIEDGRQTTIKTRFSAGSQQLLRADRETTVALSGASQEALVSKVTALISKVGAVVLSDYGKGVLSKSIVRTVIDLATAAGCSVVVDPKGADYSVYAGATLVTPNRKELQEATSLPVDGDEAIVAAARRLIDDCGIGNVLVTRSQDGMTLVTRDGEVHHLPAEAREVFDVSGAGDTVVAAMAAAIATGTPLALAARLANVAAGIVVGKVGTAVVYASDLVASLHHSDRNAGDMKVATRETAADQVARWRHKGQKVGFTNGCFDLLHPGHISLLNQARLHCDRLVVGLNSDQSVKRLKGDSRPVQSEVSRATVLASLAAVDLVVIFEEDTPRELIAALHPDVLVKGADYTVDQVVGADLVQGWGGKVVLAELAPGHSTTATIARMAQ